MPNWISGSLKVRGKSENVKKFFMEGLNKYKGEVNSKTGKYETHVVPKDTWLKTDINDPKVDEFYFDILNSDWIYVEDTRRAFITGEHSIYAWFHEDDGLLYVVSDINQAWSFDPEDWMTVSSKYHIDMRLWGLECGMEFGQEIEVHDGELVLNKSFDYDNWTWEAPIPWLGG